MHFSIFWNQFHLWLFHDCSFSNKSHFGRKRRSFRWLTTVISVVNYGHFGGSLGSFQGLNNGYFGQTWLRITVIFGIIHQKTQGIHKNADKIRVISGSIGH